MTDTSSAGKDLASGSQDLSALAGLFCTDGVERNALATQTGYGTVVVSSLSLLGMLGLVKSTIKIALGLDACAKAGFSLDSLRVVYGYRKGEITSEGRLYECYDTHVKFEYNVGNRYGESYSTFDSAEHQTGAWTAKPRSSKNRAAAVRQNKTHGRCGR